MKIVRAASTNHGPRPDGVAISCILRHASGGSSAAGDVAWCRKTKPQLLELWQQTAPEKRPKAPWGPVSYHAIIERDGRIFILVETERRAWHAGPSEFLGVPDVNDYAIGLCFSNRQDGKEGFTDAQYQAGAALSAAWIRKHPAITPDRITDHSVVSPGRKVDPGPLFDDARFRELLDAEFSCR